MNGRIFKQISTVNESKANGRTLKRVHPLKPNSREQPRRTEKNKEKERERENKNI